MCLDVVHDNTHVPKASGFGWKVFSIYGGELLSWCQGGLVPYEINKWYEAYDFLADEMRDYWRGFHVFTTRTAAEALQSGQDTVVRKVRWRYRLATGTQFLVHLPGSAKCIVAKEILILPEKALLKIQEQDGVPA